ncbi:hypothetical protein VTI28DRAFT_5115 [Corynascus sepedonium]
MHPRRYHFEIPRRKAGSGPGDVCRAVTGCGDRSTTTSCKAQRQWISVALRAQIPWLSVATGSVCQDG